MVTCDPELVTMDITSDIEFLVLVSDGIWTCLTSQGVVDFVNLYLKPGKKMDPRTICQKLCDRCEVSSDNVTVILIQFKDAPAPPPAPEENLPGDAANNRNAPPPAPAENLPGDAANNNAAPPAPEETPHLRDDEITEA
ncbi:probable protein phosphatase 2C 21 [Panicum virgatum]|uniref:probable protein phosphatase 2C 21 n=1 Tax=Panicum virgatum TaxID=38727 RepID=UPI0019D5E37F|nr:probable protein phosphatase 2C 21 [Panicum virgatum]